MYNLTKQCNTGWKMTPIAAKLVSSELCFYHDIFFANRTRILPKNETSVTLSVLSVLTGWTMLRFLATGDVSTSSLVHRALIRLWQQQQCLQVTPSVSLSSSWDGPVYSPETFPATIWSQFKLDLKEKATTNERARGGANSCSGFASHESHATANVSLLALLQKLSTATLIIQCGLDLLYM